MWRLELVGNVDDDNVSGVIRLGSRLKWVEEVATVNMIYKVHKLSEERNENDKKTEEAWLKRSREERPEGELEDKTL